MAENSSASPLTMTDAKRLEMLWEGDFGDAYLDRNSDAGRSRGSFWQTLLTEIHCDRVLEVGCNLGANLTWITTRVPPQQVFGIDINSKALAQLRSKLSGVNAVWGPVRELPFRDRWFDLVFTMGVLMHQPESTLPLVMAEIVRCSRHYILCGEYFAEKTTEVPYRDQKAALFKRNYGLLYSELFPELRLLKQGFLGRNEGWDDVTYWLFEKT